MLTARFRRSWYYIPLQIAVGLALAAGYALATGRAAPVAGGLLFLILACTLPRFPSLGLVLFCLLLPLDLIQSFKIASVTPSTLLGLVSIALWVFWKLWNHRGISKAAIRVAPPMLAFVVIAVLTTALHDTLDSGLSRLSTLSQLIIVALFVSDVTSTVAGSLGWCLTAMRTSGALVGLVSLATYSGLFPGNSIINSEVLRTSGMGRDPNLTAAFLAMCVPLMLCALATTRSGRRRVVLAGAIVVVSLAIVVSGSRWGFLMLCVAPLVHFPGGRLWQKILGVGLLVGTVAALVVALVPGSLALRLTQWLYYGEPLADASIVLHFHQIQMARAAFLSAPIWGVGLSSPGFHSTPMEILAQTGLLGAVAFALTWLTPISRLRRAMVPAEGGSVALWFERATALRAAAGILLLASVPFGLHYEKYPWVLLGIISALPDAKELDSVRGENE